MAQSLADKLDAVPRKMLAAAVKADRKPLAVDWKRQQGLIFERVLELARVTKQQASGAMGYPDQSAVSRWISGVERVQWDKVAEVETLRPWIPVAWGEATGAEIQHSVIVRRSA